MMSLLQWFGGLLVTLVVGFGAGTRTERVRAKNARQERDEQERRTWRQEGGDAIADTTAALNLVRSDVIRGLSQRAQFDLLVRAYRQWRSASRALVRLAAVHTDTAVTNAAVRVRAGAEQAFDAVEHAGSLVPSAPPYTPQHLLQLLDAVSKSPPEAPHYASEDEVNDAWARVDAARAAVLGAMDDLSEALRAAVEDR